MIIIVIVATLGCMYDSTAFSPVGGGRFAFKVKLVVIITLTILWDDHDVIILIIMTIILVVMEIITIITALVRVKHWVSGSLA